MREKFSYFDLHDQAGQWRSFFLKKDSAKKYYEQRLYAASSPGDSLVSDFYLSSGTSF